MIERFKAWIKGLPWWAMVAGVAVMTVFLIVAVDGPLNWWDFPVAWIFSLFIVIFAWKLFKKAK